MHRTTITLAAAGTLAAASAVHLMWATGRRTAAPSVIPTVDGAAVFTPSARATIAVAGALAVAAGLYTGAELGARPRWLYRCGAASAGSVLVGRAIGDGRLVGVTKRVRGTPFARLDDTVLSPLCFALGVAGIAAAARR